MPKIGISAIQAINLILQIWYSHSPRETLAQRSVKQGFMMISEVSSGFEPLYEVLQTSA
jgi:hypothetical protein